MGKEPRAQGFETDFHSPMILTSTRLRRLPSNSPQKIRSQGPKSSRPSVTAPKTSRPITWRFRCASPLSSPVRLWRYWEIGSCEAHYPGGPPTVTESGGIFSMLSVAAAIPTRFSDRSTSSRIRVNRRSLVALRSL